MLDSRADKVSIVVVFFSACCWIVYASGFFVRIQQFDYRVAINQTTNLALHLPYFCQWTYLLSGLLLYLVTFVHVICGWHMCSSVLMLLLAPVNFVCGGGVLNHNGIAIYTFYTQGNAGISYNDFWPVEFTGAIGAMFFYWIFLFLWILSIQHQVSTKRLHYDIINS